VHVRGREQGVECEPVVGEGERLFEGLRGEEVDGGKENGECE